MNNYPELTAEQYREEVCKMLEKITYTQALRYFHIIVSEAFRNDHDLLCDGGAVNE